MTRDELIGQLNSAVETLDRMCQLLADLSSVPAVVADGGESLFEAAEGLGTCRGFLAAWSRQAHKAKA